MSDFLNEPVRQAICGYQFERQQAEEFRLVADGIAGILFIAFFPFLLLYSLVRRLRS